MLENSEDSYQKNVIMPNLVRLVEPKKDMTILDVACGQGYFSNAFAEHGAKVIGCDISAELIELAKKNNQKEKAVEFHISPADSIPFMTDKSADKITIVLAIQNIENLAGTLAECSRILKSDGRLFIILNHPTFRIPQNSSWQWDGKIGKQYRRIDSYMSDQMSKIDMTPGELDNYKKKFTVTFHRPLQSYFKALNKAGLSVARLEEWISHRKSQKGPRGDEEDRTRKEIPLFMCLECVRR
jgi:ubiquinone/menaquinone biosynthesis C-methylase UbiE